ncbi:MAG: cell division protein FtsH [Planctomycetes bacterium]|nr:cell division protein FtsH [Planctomycetota bacterium]
MMFLFSFGPILLFIAVIWWFMSRQMRGQGQGLLNFGRSRAVVYNTENRTGVTFADVAGIEEAKEEVAEIIEFLKNPEKFKRLGGRIPRGVLLVGSPGTGKTLLAKAIAGEAGVPFVSISGSDFVEMFVGVGASRVRDLFDQARKSAPCIIFLDEIDAVGRKRGSGMGGGNDEREQTLNAILVEMDGFGTDVNIIVIAATNRPDVLDPALLRPGRFDREIVIDLPDVSGREQILRVHTRSVKLAPEVNLADIARGTPGFSGAELAALVNEAAIIAAMKEHAYVRQEDLEEARDKVRFGRAKKSRVMEEEDKRITAYHEAGHALVNLLLDHTEPLHKVTIIPRGMALGVTMFLPEKDRLHYTRNQALDSLAVSYGGRVAEEVFCDDITSGATSDIQHATGLARAMVTRWGMSDALGPINLAERSGSDFLGNEISMGRDHSPATAKRIDEEVERMLREAQDRAESIIRGNVEAMHRITEALLEYETISGEEVRRLYEGTPPSELRPRGNGPSEAGSPPPLPPTAPETTGPAPVTPPPAPPAPPLPPRPHPGGGTT